MTEYPIVLREPARPGTVDLFIRESTRREQSGEQDFSVYFGAILSGAARIQSRFYRDEIVRQLSSTTDPIIGGEMEAVGLLTASTNWNDPVWCVVKGISDFADEDRDGVIRDYRPLACRNAALFLLRALMNDV